MLDEKATMPMPLILELVFVLLFELTFVLIFERI